jgi:hypothetical protein
MGEGKRTKKEATIGKEREAACVKGMGVVRRK